MENLKKKKKIKIVPNSFLNAMTAMFHVFIHCFSHPCNDSTKYLF